ncbi:copper chaperone PCu(A)C [Streptomyces sp. RS10V-4]|uniref:copper chaperone PCu(A)C n=1 Tax=Streptomyces rhizoryzae TaxID=2932493 RepID=UPI002006A8EB|nr:copper chaperone PCu(A)C [Streptomyces rhizoryzae]MCK7624627.1 copper chaperone PCu(A)C [Streptomyces rhizoryzae]
MSRSLRRGVLAATVLSLSIATLSACGAGSDAQTLQVKPDNAETSVGDIKIQNANVVTQPDVNAKGPAAITATVFNSGTQDQQLTGISVDGTGQSATLSGKITVPAGGSVVLGGKDNPNALLPTGREAVQDGNVQPLTFSFSSAGKVKLNAYVVPAKNIFESYGPSQAPQPSTSASGKPSESGSASPSSSGKPSESAHAGH